MGKSKKQSYTCRYFTWLVSKRNGVYYADGRGNKKLLGRYSLGTRDEEEALRVLHELDLTMAVKLGLASRSMLEQPDQIISIDNGCQHYRDHVNRPRAAGGVKAKTATRYRPVLDKFEVFCQDNQIRYWNEVTRAVFDKYVQRLEDDDYAIATIDLELTTLRQVHKHLIDENHLPNSTAFKYSLKLQSNGTTTYCYTDAEVAAILKHCNNDELRWLHAIIVGLCHTGMRISELAELRWSDISGDLEGITVKDETHAVIKHRDRRTTKSGRSRSFPIHPDLKIVLQLLPRDKDGRVFHGPKGGKVKPDTIRNILIRDVLTPLAPLFPVNDDQQNLLSGRLHSFRHYFCSYCANNGVPEPVVMKWMGHQDSEMVRHYYHLHEEESRRQMSRLPSIQAKLESM